jgi:hypothetical protein
MIVRTLATFQTSLPDDRIEKDDGTDFIRWPGLNVALAVADLLRSIGWTADDPIDLEHRGWDLYADLGSKGIRIRISLIDEVIVDITDRTPDWTWFFRRKPGSVFIRMVTELDKALKADGRFWDIRWYTFKGYPTETGAPVPIDVGP